MKIALDPYMFRRVPLTELPGLVADLGYSCIELSPREDFLPFFLHPRADKAQIAGLAEGANAARVQIASVLPLYRWSGPDEDERQAAVRYWKRAIQITVDLGVSVMNSEFNGRPEAPSASEAQFWRSMEELLPIFEREGVRLELEPHPDDFVEDGRADGPDARDRPGLGVVPYCAPHTFHRAATSREIMEYAGPLLTHLHLADSFDHTASSGLRYIVNPPGSPARVHQHLDIGQGDVDWDVFFRTVAQVGFDGIATVCVFAGRTGARVVGLQPGPDPAVPGQVPGARRVTRRVRIGLAGLGRMGRIHAANLSGRCPSAELACVFDADADAARQVAAELGVPRAESFDDILADDTVDAVAIATLTEAHASLSVRASQAGKHVFGEKLISLDRPATVETIEAVAAAGVAFEVGFHRRFDRDWAAAVDRMRAATWATWNCSHVAAGHDPAAPAVLADSGGSFVDVTTHDLDLARWTVG